ncbi:transmembrane anchor protein [Thauera chlorobenzoica]|uniref:Uncharacterized protein n=1 Tax=Thauera chlorobenzoica TaxID=96773 RepID=A0A1H5V9C8_9RHOO|nr:transmembrane anchor protein [Thauera chlorobenzoica]APR02941.1 hypothetical protein Tchl_0065 [Thauera chlorobenzoica]SEF83057.1 hypothetical protein SAMN05216242_10724 [Thauera chlorobenzoica]
MYNTDLPKRADLPSTGNLLRSTALAALIAGGLLVTTVLPAEYGIDPTGIGRALGLTPMGEIKMSLAAEARAEERVATETAPSQPVAVAPAARAEAAPAPVAVAAPTPTAVAPEPAAGRKDTVTVTLKPGQGAEVKLTMNKDSRVRYEWASAGGPVNFDTHGDPYDAPKNFYHGYGKGRNELGNQGDLVAAFDGKHGWFWRNRSGFDVTVTLKIQGDYTKIERVL